MKKRIIALLLSLVMLTSLLTPTALATEDEASGTTQEEVVKSNENERSDQPGETENGDAKDENQDPQQPTTGDEEQPTGQDEPKNEDETKGEDGQPGEEPKQPEQPGDDQPTEPEQGEETETPEEPEEPEFDAEAVYAQLMACETAEEMDAIAAELTEEQIAQFSDEQLAAIEAHYAELKGEEPEEEPEEDVVDNGIVDFTDVAPLVEMDTDVVTPGILKAALLGAAGRPADPYPDSTRQDANGVETSKNVTGPDKDGNYTITMEAYTTGNVTVSGGTPIPTDVVLVLDQSGSMAFGFGDPVGTVRTMTAAQQELGKEERYYACKDSDGNWYEVQYRQSRNNGFQWMYYDEDYNAWYTFSNNRTSIYETRLTALKKAVENFVDSVAAKAKEDNVEHRVAMVGFANCNTGLNQKEYANTELFVGNNSYTYNAGSGSASSRNSAQQHYSEAFQNMKTDAGVANVKASIDLLDASGATYADLGIEMANGISASNPLSTGEERNRVIVMFTDGSPGYKGSWGDTAYGGTTTGYFNPTYHYDDARAVAKKAIEQAYVSKNTHDATVYTIGIFGGADPNSTSEPNQYMNYVSSNYKNAQSMSNPGESTKPSDGTGYYLSASNATALNTIFDKISQQIQSGAASIDLSAATVIKDVMSKYFTLPEGATADDITIYTANATGEKVNGKYQFGDWDKSDLNATLGTDENGNQTVSVTGFDFNRNFVADKGRVEGDATQSGDFYGRKLIIQFQVKAKSEFWGGNAVPTNDPSSGIYNGDGVVENFEHPTADVKLKVPTVNGSTTNIYYGGTIPDTLYTINDYDPDMMAYVDVDKTQIATPSNTEDTDATVTVTVGPKYTGNITEPVKGEGKVIINVFKPEITWKDSAIELGAEANYANNFAGVKWMHEGQEAPKAMGTAPELAYEYSPEQGAFTVDTPVKVTVKLKDTDTVVPATFKHEKCGFAGCGFNANTEQFIVHIKPFDLTITKSGWDTIDENQAFVFHVTGTDVDMYVTINFPGKGEVTIKDLKPGTYKITEESGWSWRYEVTDGASKTIEPKNVGISTPGQASVSFANSRTKTLWLNGCSWAVNNWNNTEATKSPATPGKTN